jgi:hypothetical protein
MNRSDVMQGVASTKASKLCMQETKVETALASQTPIQKEHLLSTKDMTELSLLQHSVVSHPVGSDRLSF